MLCNLKITGVPGLPSYEETDLMGFEPNSKTYHWFAVTNAGETHDHVTPATDKNKLRFTYSGTQEGKPFKEVVDWEFLGATKPGDKPNEVMFFRRQEVSASQYRPLATTLPGAPPAINRLNLAQAEFVNRLTGANLYQFQPQQGGDERIYLVLEPLQP